MTPFVLLYLVTSLAVLAIAWTRGGHPERLGVLIFLIGWMVSLPLNDVRIGGLRVGVVLADTGCLAAFLWLALKRERWWPLGVCACMVLILAVHLSSVLMPGVTALGETSAQLGLGMLAVLIQGAGVFERWLAGEAPASAQAIWKRTRSAS